MIIESVHIHEGTLDARAQEIYVEYWECIQFRDHPNQKGEWRITSSAHEENIHTCSKMRGYMYIVTSSVVSTQIPLWNVILCGSPLIVAHKYTSTFLSCNSSLKTLLLERASVRSNETNQEKPIGAVKGKQWVYISSIPFIHNICAHINCFSNWADPFDINPWIFPL